MSKDDPFWLIKIVNVERFTVGQLRIQYGRGTPTDEVWLETIDDQGNVTLISHFVADCRTSYSEMCEFARVPSEWRRRLSCMMGGWRGARRIADKGGEKQLVEAARWSEMSAARSCRPPREARGTIH
jgi:hypothetical protein